MFSHATLRPVGDSPFLLSHIIPVFWAENVELYVYGRPVSFLKGQGAGNKLDKLRFDCVFPVGGCPGPPFDVQLLYICLGLFRSTNCRAYQKEANQHRPELFQFHGICNGMLLCAGTSGVFSVDLVPIRQQVIRQFFIEFSPGVGQQGGDEVVLEARSDGKFGAVGVVHKLRRADVGAGLVYPSVEQQTRWIAGQGGATIMVALARAMSS